MLTYHRPQAIEDTLALIRDAPGSVRPLAGGTDLMPRWSKGLADMPDAVIDLKRVEGLAGVSRVDDWVRIGPCTLLADIESDPLIRASAPVLAEAAGRIACPQIRNRATIGGNLCNASPAADSAIPLILLDAMLELASIGPDGLITREVPVADFFHGPGQTDLAAGEILSAICFRPLSDDWFAEWQKFGTRPAMEIAVASVGVAFRLAGSTVSDARVGYGSVAPVPLRGTRAEVALNGKRLTDAVIEQAVEAARGEISPISDLRASDSYRREIVGVLLGRMLRRAIDA